MAEIASGVTGWLDAQKRSALNALALAMSDPCGAAKEFLHPSNEAFAETKPELFQRSLGMAGSVMPEMARAGAQGVTDIAATGMEAPAFAGRNPLAARSVQEALFKTGPPHNSLGIADPFYPWGNEAAISALVEQHGLSPQNIKKIQDYAQVPPETILSWFDKAKESFSRLYQTGETTSAERAARMGFGELGDPEKWLWRGSKTPRAELEPPIVTGARATGAPDAVFGSFPGKYVLAKGYGPVQTPLVARFQKEDLFDALDPGHLERLRTHTPDIESPWSRSWVTLESPHFTKAIREADFPGFITDEADVGIDTARNFGLFHPEMLRHPLAAFDPEQFLKRNLFAGFAPMGAISALAAAMLPQQQDGQP